jgi:hypothetical protein
MRNRYEDSDDGPGAIRTRDLLLRRGTRPMRTDFHRCPPLLSLGNYPRPAARHQPLLTNWHYFDTEEGL